jgi:hypothetical protein
VTITIVTTTAELVRNPKNVGFRRGKCDPKSSALPVDCTASIPPSFGDDYDEVTTTAEISEESKNSLKAAVENATLESSALPGIDCLYSSLVR